MTTIYIQHWVECLGGQQYMNMHSDRGPLTPQGWACSHSPIMFLTELQHWAAMLPTLLCVQTLTQKAMNFVGNHNHSEMVVLALENWNVSTVVL